MYCSYCGCKLDSTAKKCPSCGNDARSEYCGGFWGLVGEKEPQKPELAAEKKNMEETQIMSVDSRSEVKSSDMEKAFPENGIEEVEKKRKISQKLVIGILLVSVLVCVIQTARLTISNRKLTDIQEEKEIISQEYGEMAEEKEEAEKKCAELLVEKENAEKKYGEMVEEKTEVEKQNDKLESENKELKAFNLEEANKGFGFLKPVLPIQGVE